MPGYVILFLFLSPVLQEIPRFAKSIGDASLGAFFAIGGPVVGLLLFHIYEFSYRRVVWRHETYAKFLGLDYVPRLRKLLNDIPRKNKTDVYEMKAFWDSAFFTVLNHDVRERILFLNSRAHSWGVMGFGTILVWVWYCWRFLTHQHLHGLWIFVVVFLFLVSIPAYVQSMKHAGRLEFQEYLKCERYVKMEAETIERLS